MNANTDLRSLQRNASLLASDAVEGLAQPRKTLPCKWFYDERGSELFERITQTPEYYPTRVETRLLTALSTELAQYIPDLRRIIEPGSGSSNKTRILLESQPGLREYIPMDISADFLHASAAQLAHDFPRLTISPLVCDFTMLDAAPAITTPGSCLLFFPGSTIGNFSTNEAVALLKNLRRLVAGQPGWLLLGVDMTQDQAKLEAAYDDASGVTAQFNLNLLARINRELDADFDLSRFAHRAFFNAAQHRVEMHLVSLCPQQVQVAERRFEFQAGETIHTENSHKYPQVLMEALLQQAGWSVVRLWLDDEESGFGVYLLRAIN
ncbi:MAG TPA: L-histidine N(alpha)-methyltransferase [Methylophilaceae bacterium]|nr:L-histidine N(alpha)-methyltransferase [Methylophilaceae bacterium]